MDEKLIWKDLDFVVKEGGDIGKIEKDVKSLME